MPTRKNQHLKERRQTALFNLERRHGRRPAEDDKAKLFRWEKEEQEIATLKERIR